jgi:hypothetical protein
MEAKSESAPQDPLKDTRKQTKGIPLGLSVTLGLILGVGAGVGNGHLWLAIVGVVLGGIVEIVNGIMLKKRS